LLASAHHHAWLRLFGAMTRCRRMLRAIRAAAGLPSTRSQAAVFARFAEAWYRLNWPQSEGAASASGAALGVRQRSQALLEALRQTAAAAPAVAAAGFRPGAAAGAGDGGDVKEALGELMAADAAGEWWPSVAARHAESPADSGEPPASFAGHAGDAESARNSEGASASPNTALIRCLTAGEQAEQMYLCWGHQFRSLLQTFHLPLLIQHASTPGRTPFGSCGSGSVATPGGMPLASFNPLQELLSILSSSHAEVPAIATLPGSGVAAVPVRARTGRASNIGSRDSVESTSSHTSAAPHPPSSTHHRLDSCAPAAAAQESVAAAAAMAMLPHTRGITALAAEVQGAATADAVPSLLIDGQAATAPGSQRLVSARSKGGRSVRFADGSLGSQGSVADEASTVESDAPTAATNSSSCSAEHSQGAAAAAGAGAGARAALAPVEAAPAASSLSAADADASAGGLPPVCAVTAARRVVRLQPPREELEPSVPVAALRSFLQLQGLAVSPGNPLLWQLWTAVTTVAQPAGADVPASDLAEPLETEPRMSVGLCELVVPGCSNNVIARALLNRLSIPSFPSFLADLLLVHASVRDTESGGALCTDLHIDELAAADPEAFCVSVVSADGQVANVGEGCLREVPLTAVVRPLLYALACKDNGIEAVHDWVGAEPTAEEQATFALLPPSATATVGTGAASCGPSITVPEGVPQLQHNASHGSVASLPAVLVAAPTSDGFGSSGSSSTPESSAAAAERAAAMQRPKPYNAFLDSGALAVCSLIGRAHLPPRSRLFHDNGSRFSHMVKEFSRWCGRRKVPFSNSAFLAQKQKRLRTRAVCFYAKGMNALPPNADPVATAEYLYQAEALEMSSQNLAIVAATLANAGVCPLTDEAVLSPAIVRSTLSLCYSSGLASATGHWAFTVGAPAASGQSGLVMAVVPRIMGLAIWSPRVLANRGCLPPRALAAMEMLASKYSISLFDLASRQDAPAEAARVRAPRRAARMATTRGLGARSSLPGEQSAGGRGGPAAPRLSHSARGRGSALGGHHDGAATGVAAEAALLIDGVRGRPARPRLDSELSDAPPPPPPPPLAARGREASSSPSAGAAGVHAAARAALPAAAASAAGVNVSQTSHAAAGLRARPALHRSSSAPEHMAHVGPASSPALGGLPAPGAAQPQPQLPATGTGTALPPPRRLSAGIEWPPRERDGLSLGPLASPHLQALLAPSSVRGLCRNPLTLASADFGAGAVPGLSLGYSSSGGGAGEGPSPSHSPTAGGATSAVRLSGWGGSATHLSPMARQSALPRHGSSPQLPSGASPLVGPSGTPRISLAMRRQPSICAGLDEDAPTPLAALALPDTSDAAAATAATASGAGPGEGHAGRSLSLPLSRASSSSSVASGFPPVQGPRPAPGAAAPATSPAVATLLSRLRRGVESAAPQAAADAADGDFHIGTPKATASGAPAAGGRGDNADTNGRQHRR
jgi:glutaminase